MQQEFDRTLKEVEAKIQRPEQLKELVEKFSRIEPATTALLLERWDNTKQGDALLTEVLRSMDRRKANEVLQAVAKRKAALARGLTEARKEPDNRR